MPWSMATPLSPIIEPASSARSGLIMTLPMTAYIGAPPFTVPERVSAPSPVRTWFAADATTVRSRLHLGDGELTYGAYVLRYEHHPVHLLHAGGESQVTSFSRSSKSKSTPHVARFLLAERTRLVVGLRHALPHPLAVLRETLGGQVRL